MRVNEEHIFIYGDSKAVIENHLGIRCYEYNKIRIQFKEFWLEILGEQFAIENYSKDIVIIKGRIRELKYLS